MIKISNQKIISYDFKSQKVEYDFLGNPREPISELTVKTSDGLVIYKGNDAILRHNALKKGQDI